MPDQENLSWDEIKRRFPDEWVALVEQDWPNNESVPRSGIVYAHDPDHQSLIDKQKHLKVAAIVWTGKKRGEMLQAALRVDD